MTLEGTDFPYIDPRVEHVGVSKLRLMNATTLKTVRNTIVIQENDRPLAVLVNYEQYLSMQSKLRAPLKGGESRHNGKEAAGRHRDSEGLHGQPKQ